MSITKIKDNVQALLTATDYFVTVLPAAPSQQADFAGYPSACHYYIDTASDYATVSQNRRVIEYIVEMYLVTPTTVTLSDQFAQAYKLLDDVIDMFDHTIDLSEGLGTTLGLTRACEVMRPAPGTMTRVTINDGPGLMLEIRLFCEIDKSFR